MVRVKTLNVDISKAQVYSVKREDGFGLNIQNISLHQGGYHRPRR